MTLRQPSSVVEVATFQHLVAPTDSGGGNMFVNRTRVLPCSQYAKYV